MKKFLTILIFFVSLISSDAQEIIPLYPENNHSPAIFTENFPERVYDVTTPTLIFFKPQKQDFRKIGIILCPGGGYSYLSIKKEGYAIAQELNKWGITVFVLMYRLPSSKSETQSYLTPLSDALKAIEVVRKNAKKWDIDPNKLGIMGFSAGGHLAASASTLFEETIIANPQNISLRPDFTILGYPVISLKKGITHAGSKKELLANAKNKEVLEAKFSIEENVSLNTPPAFIFLASDDKVVSPKNAILYFESLRKNGVNKCSLIIYPEGGHGFGLHLPNENQKWIQEVMNWLDTLYKKQPL